MTMGETKSTYLGDGAYVEWTGYSFVVYTSNGIERTNEVYLEADAIAKLIEFAQSVVSAHGR